VRANCFETNILFL